MADEATPEQKLNIATYFIMSSPTGEVDDVVTDVTKLVDDPATLDDAALERILKDYNTEQLVWASDPTNPSASVMVSAHGMVESDLFVDPNTGNVLKFDHTKRQFLEVTDKKAVLSDEVAGYRAAIQKSVDEYLKGQFKAGKAIAAVYGSDAGAITICISAKNINLAAYWTGGWRSVYTINVAEKGKAELKGNVKSQVHYFEEGNVQLHSNKDFSTTVTVAGEEETGKEIGKAISKLESEFQSNMEEMYVNMHRTTFKSMRRFLPISKNPMTWNLAAHNLAGEVARAT